MRWMVMVVALMIAARLSVVGLAAQEMPNKYEQRLVAAELREIGEGDLGGAMKAYAALHADAEAPKAVRARAALCLARCERKRGRLAAAERLLAALVRDFAQEKQVVKTAQSFLRELRTGKPENPDFDWMGALEKNPEIQARVFKLAMDVAEPGGSQGILARKQLQALGRVAVPMLRKLCATSREPVHRQVLATILIQAGSFERLDVLFGGAPLAMDDDELPWMIEAVIRFEPEDKTRLLEAARAMKPHPDVVPWLATLRLAAGETIELADLLKTLEQYDAPSLGWSSLKWEPSRILAERARREPVIEPVLVQRLKDPKCEEMAADTYLEILRGRVFKHFTLDQVTRLLIRVGSATDISSYTHEFFARWEKKKTYGPITAMARHKKLHAEITKYLERRYDWKRKPESIPAGWAGVLKAGGLFDDLHRIAERNDGFGPVFESFMRERAKLAPKFRGHRRVTSRDSRLRLYQRWSPSARYAEVMARLLEVNDSITRMLALEALALARPGVGPVTTEATLKLFEAEITKKSDVAWAALASLAARFSSRPSTGPALVSAILGVARQGIGPMPVDDRPFNLSLPDSYGPRLLRGYYDLHAPIDPHREALLPFLLARADSDLGLRSLRGLVVRMEKGDRVRVLTKALRTTSDPGQLNALLALESIHLEECASTEPGKAALKRCAENAKLEPVGRAAAVDAAWPSSVTWVDWVAVIREDPALMGAVKNLMDATFRHWFRQQPGAYRAKVVTAAMQSESPVIRAWAVRDLSFDLGSPVDQAALVEKAIGDPAEDVSHAVWHVLMVSPSARVAPLLVRLLTEPRFAWCLERYPMQTFQRIARLAPPEAIPVLVKLLDHENIVVRTSALETLREIKKALDEKAEWKRVVEEMQKPGEKAAEKNE